MIKLLFFLTLALPSLGYTATDADFASIMNAFLSSKHTPAQRKEILLGSLPQMHVAPLTDSPEAFIESIDKTYRGFKPESLVDAAKASQSRTADLTALKKSLKGYPVTIVIFPGIFSEFIQTRAMEEVFQRTSSVNAIAWKSRMAIFSHSACLTGEEAHCDKSYALRNLQLSEGMNIPYKFQSLDKYLNVASIDDADGKPLVTAILLKTEGLSMETLSTMRENTETFTRRLEKYFDLMGVPQNLVFLGYSRGTMVALDTLSYGFEQRKPWISNVRGMISLGGVTYGTALADEAFVPGTTNSQLITKLKGVLANLQEIDDATLEAAGYHNVVTRNWARLSRHTNNTKLFIQFGTSLGFGMDDLTKLREQNQGTDLQSALRTAYIQASNFGTFEGIHLTKLPSSFGELGTLGIRKFKFIVEKILAAVEQMQTKERLRWWAEHDLPVDGVHYYSLAGVMSPSLATHTTTFNPNTADDRMLLQNYADYLKSSGMAMNDSQVAIQRVRFWPELNEMLNPRNAGMNTSFLGVVGTHHWGLALAIVNQNKNKSVNPFPRIELLESLAAVVASEINH